MTEQPLNPETFLSANFLAERYGVHQKTIWRWTRNGQFPAPIQLTPGCTRWRHADVLAWEQSRPEAA